MITINILIVIATTLVYWMRGGHGLARWTGSQVWKVAYGALLALPILAADGGWTLYAVGALAAFGFVTIGHGTGLDMGRRSDYRDDDELLSVFARKILRLDPSTKTHDVAVMTTSGFLYGVPLLLLGPIALVVCVGLGLTKASAYTLGWDIVEKHSRDPIPIAELITGFLQGLVLTMFMNW